MKHENEPTERLILPPGQGCIYNCGTKTSIFKADVNETKEKYSISEWWLETNFERQEYICKNTIRKQAKFWIEPLHFLWAISISRGKRNFIRIRIIKIHNIPEDLSIIGFYRKAA